MTMYLKAALTQNHITLISDNALEMTTKQNCIHNK